MSDTSGLTDDSSLPLHRHKQQLAKEASRDRLRTAIFERLAPIWAWFALPRTRLGLSGLILVWWGFSLRHDPSYGFQRWYVHRVKWLIFTSEQFPFSQVQVKQELREFGLIIVAIGLPLIWLAAWDWLQARHRIPVS